MAGMEVPACRANSSASMTLSPEGIRMGVAPGRGLGLGDPGHRRADDPGHLHGRVHVDQAHGHHGLEQPDGLDVHFGEDGVVVPDVEEAEGPPEPPGQLDGDVGGLGHLGLGQPVLGGHQHPVHHQQVDHVVGHGPVDLRIGAARGRGGATRTRASASAAVPRRAGLDRPARATP